MPVYAVVRRIVPFLVKGVCLDFLGVVLRPWDVVQVGARIQGAHPPEGEKPRGGAGDRGRVFRLTVPSHAAHDHALKLGVCAVTCRAGRRARWERARGEGEGCCAPCPPDTARRGGSAAASGRHNDDVRHRRRGRELAVRSDVRHDATRLRLRHRPCSQHRRTRCRSACRGQPRRFCGTATGDAGGRWFGSSGAGPSFWPRTARSFEPTARRRTLRSSPPTRPSLRGLVRPRPRCAGGSFSRTARWQAHPAHRVGAPGPEKSRDRPP